MSGDRQWAGRTRPETPQVGHCCNGGYFGLVTGRHMHVFFFLKNSLGPRQTTVVDSVWRKRTTIVFGLSYDSWQRKRALFYDWFL